MGTVLNVVKSTILLSKCARTSLLRIVSDIIVLTLSLFSSGYISFCGDAAADVDAAAAAVDVDGAAAAATGDVMERRDRVEA